MGALSILQRFRKSVSVERPVSVSYDWNIRGHLRRWSTYLISAGVSRNSSRKPILCPNRPFAVYDHMVQKTAMLESKPPTETSKTKEYLVNVSVYPKFDHFSKNCFSLFQIDVIALSLTKIASSLSKPF